MVIKVGSKINSIEIIFSIEIDSIGWKKEIKLYNKLNDYENWLIEIGDGIIIICQALVNTNIIA